MPKYIWALRVRVQMENWARESYFPGNHPWGLLGHPWMEINSHFIYGSVMRFSKKFVNEAASAST